MPDKVNHSGRASERKLTANQQFIADACEAWNELRHPSWPTVNVRKPSTRLIMYLQKLYKYADKDPDEATRIVRVGLSWIRKHDEWARGQVFTFEQIAANEKLEAAASKADHARRVAQEASGQAAPPPEGRHPTGEATAGRSGGTTGVQPGAICSAFGSSQVEVLRDLLGNGHVFLVRHLSTGLMERVAHYDLQPARGIAA